MSKIVWIIFGLIVLIAIGKIIINNIKDKAYQKGFIAGESEVVRSLIDKSYWFTSTDKKIFNALHLFALRYRKYNRVDANKYREDLSKMNHDKIFIISEDEIDNVV